LEAHRYALELNTVDADYPNPDYPNCQLTESPQRRNASAKQLSLLDFLNKAHKNANL
jgi:hypothetical protein